MTSFGINSIYLATEGEGVHIGTPQIFVRFQGCAIGCVNCDSKETWDFTETGHSLDSVLEEIESEAGQYPYRIKRVSITGGDPLHPKHTPAVVELSRELKKRGYYINIEASGSRVVDEVFDIVDFISFDFKTPSTGVKTNLKLLKKVFEQYSNKAQVKSVITDKNDFDHVYASLTHMNEVEKIPFDILAKTPWLLTPCYEPHEEFPRERFINTLKFNQAAGSPFRVVGQQHKWVFGPDKKLV